MPLDNQTKELIRKYAIKNAMEYGKAREDNVFGKLLSKNPELKQHMTELRVQIKETVAKVNGLPKNMLEEEAKKYENAFQQEYEAKVEKTGRPSFMLEGAKERDFKTRFPPEPNGYMHIGHAKAVFLEQEITKIYKGRLALYFDDTNPENEKQEFVDAFKRDLKWLGISFDDEYFASDSIETTYKHAEVLIGRAKAYVCDCDQEKLRESREKGIPCKHRGQPKQTNLKLWKDMLSNKAKENTALLYMGDLKATNTVMRDPVLFRIKAMPHYRQGSKYTVWPTYNFNTPVLDSINGITDTLRSKEYELRDELYNTLLSLLNLRTPRIHSFSRLEIKGNMTSKRKLNELIRHGLIKGYDDPRLVTITALRRRGIRPEAIREFVLKFGLSKTDTKTDIETLLAYNRKLIDKDAKRLFSIENPVKLIVDKIPADLSNAKMKVHPSEELGNREYKLDGKLIINKKDASALKVGKVTRLKDLFNIKITKVGKESINAEYQSGTDSSERILWLSENDAIDCKIIEVGNLLNGEEFNPDSLKTTHCRLEGYSSQLNENDVVQLETRGFFKLDNKKDMSFLSL